MGHLTIQYRDMVQQSAGAPKEKTQQNVDSALLLPDSLRPFKEISA